MKAVYWTLFILAVLAFLIRAAPQPQPKGSVKTVDDFEESGTVTEVKAYSMDWKEAGWIRVAVRIDPASDGHESLFDFTPEDWADMGSPRKGNRVGIVRLEGLTYKLIPIKGASCPPATKP